MDRGREMFSAAFARGIVAALAVLLLAGCVVSPRNGEMLEATDAPIDFGGFASAPGRMLRLEVSDCATGEWSTLATARSAAVGVPFCGGLAYPWQIEDAVLPQEEAAWCREYGVLWSWARVVDEHGTPLVSFGEPWQAPCEVSDVCDPTLVERCGHVDGMLMLLCTEGAGGGCIDRLG